jgi:hypothetical protein
MPVIPALCRPRQEDHEYQASLIYIARPCVKKPKRKQDKKKEERMSTASRDKIMKKNAVLNVIITHKVTFE